MPVVGAQVRISGMVQGVGYRYFCYQRAINLGLSGWVRNQPDGTVRASIEGERSLIESLVEELRAGPPASSVTEIEIEWAESTGSYQTFEITRAG